MTLSRQLTLLIAALVALLFLGTFSISVLNTRAYLEQQLASHAQDAATSLGLSATSHFASDDRALVTSMVNAMFHRGDYLMIRLETLQGEAWIERTTDRLTDTVPGWFVRAFALSPPERSATMMSGWRQMGRVRVVSHPGLAYEKLWQTTRQTLSLFLLVALLVLLSALFGLRLLLRPIKAIEAQAEAICNREYVTSDRPPFTLEFRRVVEAMDRLSEKVGRMLGEAEGVATRLRQQAYQDPVTGLANRRQFMEVLEHRVNDPELFGSGAVLLVQLRDVKAFNLAHGYTAGDRLLADAAQRLAAAVADLPHTTVAHLSGGDFGLLIEGISPPQLEQRAARLAEAVAGLCNRFPLESSDVGHVGAVPYAGQTATELLADADLALREAQAAGANAWRIQRVGQSRTPPRASSTWRALIEQALDRGLFDILRQPVVTGGEGALLHDEVFLRLRDPDNLNQDIAAAVFMPMAESVGLAPRVDRAVVSRVMQLFDAGEFEGRVAVNLSPHSLVQDAFVEWLVETLNQRPEFAGRLVLEFPEYGVSSNVGPLEDLIGRLAGLGVGFSLDHFGKGFSSFAYLHSVKLDYLKIDGSFIRHLDSRDDSHFFIKTVVDIAHGLDMQVIAESVEHAPVWTLLQGLGVDGGRGYLFGRPE